MSNSPGQVPQPNQQPQVSDKTIDAFMAVDDGKKREALSKMSEPTKQALLQGIQKRKGSSLSQPAAQPQGPPPTSTSNPTPTYTGGYAGFTPEHLVSATGQGLKNFAQGITGASPLTPGPSGETRGEGGPIELISNIEKHLPEMSEQSDEIRRQAKEAFKRGKPGDTVEGMTKAILAIIPMMGPWLNDKYNQAMSGDIGGSVAETAMTAAAAKLVEHLQGKSITTATDLKNAFPKHVIVAAANDYIEKGAKDFKQTVGEVFKAAKDQGVGQPAQRIVKADKVDSQTKGLPGFVSQANISKVIDQTVDDKGAGPSYKAATVDMPGTKMIVDALSKKGTHLSWDDVKDIRTMIDYASKVAFGKDAAVVGDLRGKFTTVMKQRAAQLGMSDEFNQYVDVNKRLSDHQKGILSKLNNADTGLKLVNELAKQSNRPQLDDLMELLRQYGGLPGDYVKDFLENHKKSARLAALSEGTSYVGDKGGRIASVMRHPIVAGGASGVAYAAGQAANIPLGARFLGSLYAAVKADDLMNRYEAAREIREMGGPSGVTGQRPSSSAPPSPSTSLSSTQQGPGGGGTPVGGLPSGTSPGTPPGSSSGPSGSSPLLTAAKTVGEKEAKGAEAAKVVSENKPFQQAQFDSAIDKAKETIRDKDSTPEEKKIAASQLKSYREQAAKLADETKTKSEPKVTKASPEERGRTESARKGMTKDTPEARKAKAAERIAAKRKSGEYATQTSGGDVASKVEAMKKPGGKIDQELPEVIRLEDKYKEVKGEGGQLIIARFRKAAKVNGWSVEVYKEALKNEIIRLHTEATEFANKSKAIESAIPGLKKD